MIITGFALAFTLWAVSWIIVMFMRAEETTARLAIVVGWSLVPTWIGVDNGLFRPYMMAALIIPIVYLSWRHLQIKWRFKRSSQK